VITPLLAMESPVSAGVLVPEANNKLSLPDGLEVLLPVGSACRLKVWFTAALLLLLNEEACRLAGCEFLPPVEAAVPVAGNCSVPRTVPAPLTSSVEAGVVVFKPTLAELPVPL
jgi:hypothetical protein